MDTSNKNLCTKRTMQLSPIERNIIIEYRKGDGFTKEMVHRALQIDKKNGLVRIK